jgi:hypothetical protein
MNKLNITRENLNKLEELTNKVTTQEELASELLRVAQDRFSLATHKLMRDNKEIELTEKVLFDEVFYLGSKCQAGEILRKAHPEVFEAFDKQEEYATELFNFSMENLGVDYKKMTLSKTIMVAEAVARLILEESKQ